MASDWNRSSFIAEHFNASSSCKLGTQEPMPNFRLGSKNEKNYCFSPGGTHTVQVMTSHGSLFSIVNRKIHHNGILTRNLWIKGEGDSLNIDVPL